MNQKKNQATQTTTMTIEPPIVMMVCVNDHEEVGWKGGLLSTCWVCGAVGKGPEFWDDSPEEQSR